MDASYTRCHDASGARMAVEEWKVRKSVRAADPFERIAPAPCAGPGLAVARVGAHIVARSDRTKVSGEASSVEQVLAWDSNGSALLIAS